MTDNEINELVSIVDTTLKDKRAAVWDVARMLDLLRCKESYLMDKAMLMVLINHRKVEIDQGIKTVHKFRLADPSGLTESDSFWNGFIKSTRIIWLIGTILAFAGTFLMPWSEIGPMFMSMSLFGLVLSYVEDMKSKRG